MKCLYATDVTVKNTLYYYSLINMNEIEIEIDAGMRK